MSRDDRANARALAKDKKDQETKVLKNKEPKKKVIKKIVQKPVKMDNKEFLSFTMKYYESLLSVFSSKDHLIIGRDKEESEIKSHLENSSDILYICGHPGQGKTAVLNQVLGDHFENNQNSVIFKYNAMSY
jgi:hypothetical protein